MQFHSGFVGVVALAPFAFYEWVHPQNLFDMLVMISLEVIRDILKVRKILELSRE